MKNPRHLWGGVRKTVLRRDQRSGTKPHGADRAGAGKAKRCDRKAEIRKPDGIVRQRNACTAQAKEIVKMELIYD